MSDFHKLGQALRKNARTAITQSINGALPPALRVNPDTLGDDDDDGDGDDDDDDDDGEDEGDEDGEESMALCFEYPDADRNLASAAAAFRALGGDDDVVAVYDDGRAFFGSPEDLQEYNDVNDLNPDKWDVYDEAEEILGLDYDKDAVTRILRMAEEQGDAYLEAQKQFEEFHWGDKSKTTSIVEIPGIAGPCVRLGVMRRIEYGAKKDGKWEEYYHLHGEESGKYPTLYAAGDPDGKGHYRTLVIHGGNMHVEDRGVID